VPAETPGAVGAAEAPAVTATADRGDGTAEMPPPTRTATPARARGDERRPAVPPSAGSGPDVRPPAGREPAQAAAPAAEPRAAASAPAAEPRAAVAEEPRLAPAVAAVGPPAEDPARSPAPRLHVPGPDPLPARDVERFLALERVRPAAPLPDGGEMRLEATPEGLGRVEVRVVVQAESVRATLWAQHDHAREALAAHRPALEAALGRAQLRLDGFAVGSGPGHEQAPAEGRPPRPAPGARAARAAAIPAAGVAPAAPTARPRGALSLRA
jgi:hypothetical protein